MFSPIEALVLGLIDAAGALDAMDMAALLAVELDEAEALLEDLIERGLVVELTEQ